MVPSLWMGNSLVGEVEMAKSSFAQRGFLASTALGTLAGMATVMLGATVLSTAVSGVAVAQERHHHHHGGGGSGGGTGGTTTGGGGTTTGGGGTTTGGTTTGGTTTGG